MNSRIFKDQLGREITVNFPPRKIVSLVPSQTEFLFDLGLDEEIVGITKFCIHPRTKFKTKAKVGGTKNINFEEIRIISPDLIIANKEENEEEQIKELMNHYPVWVSDVKILSDAYEMMRRVGEMVGKSEQANAIINEAELLFKNLKSQTSPIGNHHHTASYLIWRKPYMTVGADTFIHHMLSVAGFRNIYEDLKRYPEIPLEELKNRAPQYVFLSSEPYPFTGKHVEELQEVLSSSKILLVDGEMFSWYGSRLLKAPGYFQYLKTLL